MPCAGVIPGVRALLRFAAQHFVDLYFQAGIEFLEDHCQSGAHDTRADEYDIRVVCGWCGHDLPYLVKAIRLPRFGNTEVFLRIWLRVTSGSKCGHGLSVGRCEAVPQDCGRRPRRPPFRVLWGA